LTGSNIDYGEGPWGNLRLRKAMARYMDKWFHPVLPVDPDHLLFASGVTCLGEMLGFTIFEPGDGMLLSAPIYQAFRVDFGLRAEYVFTVPNRSLSLSAVC
jgi:DNA-binding transcriptional MocR family regulator